MKFQHQVRASQKPSWAFKIGNKLIRPYYKKKASKDVDETATLNTLVGFTSLEAARQCLGLLPCTDGLELRQCHDVVHSQEIAARLRMPLCVILNATLVAPESPDKSTMTNSIFEVYYYGASGYIHMER